ncbi:MAG TPA: ABC transporter ATP-binding protein [Acidobacteriota bacterium]|nr:ABC transporter ATP-binding protein [Acidobacteriota bacterium]
MLAGFACMLLQNYGYVRVPEFFKRILDEITAANRAGVVLENLLGAGVVMVLTGGAMFLMRNLIIGVSRKIEYELRERLYGRLLALDFTFYQANQTGDLMSRCTNDLSEVRTLLGPGVMYVPNALTRFLFFMPVLFALSGSLMLVVTGMLGVLILMIVVVLPRLRPMYRRIQETLAAINNRVWQVIAGIQTVKLYTMEDTEYARFETLNREYVRHQMRVATLRGFIWPFFIFMLGLVELVILAVGGAQVIRGELTLGELLQFTVMVGFLTFPVLSLGWIMSLVQQGLAALERLNYILAHPVEAPAGRPPAAAAEPAFRVRGLRYRYPGAREDTLRGVDLDIAPGRTVGITGMVGCGKSTLLRILCGLLRPEPGMVRFDGADLAELDPDSVYERVAVVPQETFLFSRTVAENIALGAGAADPAGVRAAAVQAGLDKDIQTFPHAYDEMVGERGITLSGGQKQRLAIARALWRDRPVLVFDDALSSVDAATESAILDSLRSLSRRKTLIVVSHRISALKTADVIHVMDAGRIAESGTHEELLAQQGLYFRMARLQQMELALAGGGNGD